MINLDEKYKHEYKTNEELIEEQLFSGSEQVDISCSKNNLEIETNISNIRIKEMGGDDGYNPFV
jgi:hypothetical protein